MSDITAGQYIKSLRGTMSLGRLAELTGISKTYLWRLEQGTRHPSPECLEKLAQALNTPGDVLLREYGYVSQADFAAWRVLGNKVREMTPQQLEKVIQAADDILNGIK